MNLITAIMMIIVVLIFTHCDQKPTNPTTDLPKVLFVPHQYPTIQSAINAAVDGDVISVSPGRYYENINFLGKSIEVKADGPAETVIIDGSQPSNPSEASVVIFSTSGENVVPTLDGFTITGGTGTNGERGWIGGGIYIENSKPIIKNCIIKYNIAVRGGGIACMYDSDHKVLNTGVIINCVIINNTATSGQGGGIYTHTLGNIHVNYCTVVKNGSSIMIGSSIYTASSSLIENTILYPDDVILHYAPAEFNYCDIQGGWPPGIGNIDADPMYCDSDLSDFRLTSNSPCIGAGKDGSNIGALGSCGMKYNIFDYPFELGNTWTYKYSYHYQNQGTVKNITSIRFWSVVDSSYDNDLTRFKFRAINYDTTVSTTHFPPYLDTSYTIDTSNFYIERHSSMVVVKSPETFYGAAGDTLKGIFDGTKTVIFQSGDINDNGVKVIYKEGLGLLSSEYRQSTNTIIKEKLNLIEFNGQIIDVNNVPLWY